MLILQPILWTSTNNNQSRQLSVLRKILKIWFSSKMALLLSLQLLFKNGWMPTSLRGGLVVVVFVISNSSQNSWLFLWGWLKKQGHSTKPTTLEELMREYEKLSFIPQNFLVNSVDAILKWLEELVANGSVHIEF